MFARVKARGMFLTGKHPALLCHYVIDNVSDNVTVRLLSNHEISYYCVQGAHLMRYSQCYLKFSLKCILFLVDFLNRFKFGIVQLKLPAKAPALCLYF